MEIEGIIITRSDTGITLFSRNFDEEKKDLFGGYLAALQSFFVDFSLGEISSFTTKDNKLYLTSKENILCAVIVDKRNISDKYFNLSYQIVNSYFNENKESLLRNSGLIIRTDKFSATLEPILEIFFAETITKLEVIRLYSINLEGELERIEFSINTNLLTYSNLIIINMVTYKIFILEISNNLSNRLLFMANKAANNINLREFKSKFKIMNISDPLNCERLINLVEKLLHPDKQNQESVS